MPSGVLLYFADFLDAPALAIVGVLALLLAIALDLPGLLGILVMVMPFSLGIMQFELGIVTFNPYTLGIICLFILSAGKLISGRSRLRLTSQDALVAALSASFLASTVFAPDTIKAGFLAFHAIFIPIITYFAVKANIQSDDDYRKVEFFFLGGITMLALFALWVFFVESTQARLQIFGQSSISLAALFSVALILIIYGRLWRHWLGKLVVVVLALALFTTFARGFIVLILISPLFYALIRRGRGTALLTTMLVLSLIGTLLLAATPDFLNADVTQSEQKSEQTIIRLTNPNLWINALRGRGALYNEGLSRFLESPLLGNGFSEPFDNRLGVRTPVVWHNFHVEWLEYGGLFGYLIYVALLLIHFSRYRQIARIDYATAVNLLIIFLLLTNGLTNSFTAGITPYLGFLFIALNDSRRSVLSRDARSPTHLPKRGAQN